jgi:membrane fusion protein (multidrug efflux system)
VQLSWEGGEIACVARDISRSGMLLHLAPEAAAQLPDQPLSVSCVLPLGLGALRTAVIVAGEPRTVLDDEGNDASAVAVRCQNPDGEGLAALDRLLAPGPIAVLLVGFTVTSEIPGAELVSVAGADEALALLAQRPVGVIAVGPGLSAMAARDLVRRACERSPRLETVNIVLCSASDLTIFQDLIDADRLYYLARGPVQDDEVLAILRAAVRHHRGPADDPGAVADTERLQVVLGIASQVATQEDLASAGRVIARGVEGLAGAARAYCLFHDLDTDTLWSREDPDEDERRESASVGITSYVIRTGESLQVDRVGDDPRHDRDADDPAGRGDEQLLAVPVRTAEDEVLAVLVAIRSASAPPFSSGDHETLRLLSEQCASTFGQLALQARLRQASSENAPFRQEALDHYRLQKSGYGKVLELSPGWFRPTFWLLLSLVGIALLFLALNDVREYAEGPALVKIEGRTDLTALTPGTVLSVAVEPGQRVARGQLLVRFHDTTEADELERIKREFELQLVNRLRDPTDAAARQALTNLYAQKKLAEARLAARAVRAPHAGVVGDVRIRPGQHVASGEVLLALVGDRAEHFIVAMIPGQYRPQIKPGMVLRLELTGYTRVYRELTIRSIGDEVIGPQEAKRYLGPEIADALAPAGPVVLVRAPLRSATFSTQGRTYAYHDGMTGLARVRVRSESILLTLVPGLKELMRQADES